jgi:DNA-binding NarL/FixJ family response regulator
MKTRVLLVDDHILFLEALNKLLEPVCNIVGTASDGRSLISLAEKLRPEVIVTDIHMPNLNGFDACEQLLKKLPHSRIIFLTMNEDPDSAEEAMRRGAFGYVLKGGASAELFKAIQTVVMGRMYITPAITREPVNVFVSRARGRETNEKLTPRQREVLQLLVEGKSMKEAAAILSITPRTIAFHKYTMMQHLGVTRNSELVCYGKGIGLCGERVRAA